MGHMGSTRQRRQRAASDPRPRVVAPAGAARAGTPRARRIALHEHG
ncbi:hypothetical protein [Streptomyces alboniger]|nr:hypothetical protein [Streptomyces alboniger]